MSDPPNAMAAAEELLADENAPALSNGEHDWLKHNIARLCEWFAVDAIAREVMMLPDDKVVARLVLEYESAEKAVEAAHRTRIIALKAIINSYRAEIEKAATAIAHVAQLMMTGRLVLPTDLIEELGDALEAINKARGEVER